MNDTKSCCRNTYRGYAEAVERLQKENKKLREEYWKLDSFLQDIKAQIRDFNTRDGDYDNFNRAIADRGLIADR